MVSEINYLRRGKKKKIRLYSFICHSKKVYLSVMDYSTSSAELALLKKTSFEHANLYQKVVFVKYSLTPAGCKN